MEFKVGDWVSVIAKSNKYGVVLETGLHGANGVQWVAVKFGSSKVGRWMLADRLRRHTPELESLHIPHGVVVVVNPGKEPEVYQLNASTASEDELTEFANDVHKMWHQRRAA